MLHLLDLQLLAHFFIFNFYSYAHEQDYFDGLYIENTGLFSQMLFKEFKKYFSEEIYRNIRWETDVGTLFTQLIDEYNGTVSDLIDCYVKRARDSSKQQFSKRSQSSNRNSRSSLDANDTSSQFNLPTKLESTPKEDQNKLNIKAGKEQIIPISDTSPKIVNKTNKSPKSSLKKILNAVDATYSKKILDQKQKEPENNKNLVNQSINQSVNQSHNFEEDFSPNSRQYLIPTVIF